NPTGRGPVRRVGESALMSPGFARLNRIVDVVATPRNEERWAAACIKAALPDTEDRSYDDGSRPGMYDLDLSCSGQRVGAVEITTDADPAAIQLWKLMNGRDDRWIEPA